jgi:HlyD family secretion protein
MNAPTAPAALNPPATPAPPPPPPPPAAAPPAPAPAAKDPAPATDLATLLGDPGTRPWYRRPALWSLVALVLVAGAAIAWWLYSRAAHAAPTYNTQAVGRGDLTLTVTANGTVQPTRSINIGSELSGTVLKVNVDVNDVIKKGQVLVELDTALVRGVTRASTLAGDRQSVSSISANTGVRCS